VCNSGNFHSIMALPAGMKQCDDIMMFQNALKELRLIDDKIIYALNKSIPTASFRGQVDPSQTCKDLFQQIESTYDLREGALRACISQTQAKVAEAGQSNDRSAQRQSQLELRLYKNELSVEEVIRERTQNVFYEKCRDHADLAGNFKTHM